ncbi:hypothetical protein IWQ46_005116 [Aquimarina sp. EL_35]|nr:hypothetical protein [Aquimarina sp. EL_35]
MPRWQYPYKKRKSKLKVVNRVERYMLNTVFMFYSFTSNASRSAFPISINAITRLIMSNTISDLKSLAKN